MSKIYKAANISIGSPKHIVNAFNIEEKPKSDPEEKTEENYDSTDSENAAEAIIEDAKQMYLKIIEEANSEAQEIIEITKKEAEDHISVSKEQGYNEGFENGYLEGKKKAQSIIDEASEIREFLEQRREVLYKEAEESILTLVLDIARKVIGDELTQNKELILSLIKNALQKCAFKDKLVLRISSEDSDFVILNKNRILMMVEGISDIDIVADLSLPKGSCIIETPSGDVNSGIDIQIKEMERIFTYLLRNE